MQDEKIFRSHDLEDDYAPFSEYARKNPALSYREFDAALLRQINLFALPEYYDFEALHAVLGKIVTALPAIKRIFARPISRLKDNSEILPVESVQVINNRTIIHASAHSELWDNITDEGLKPRKLLTLNHIDTYSIYENIAFVKTVNTILAFTAHNMRLLRNILYAHRNVTVNLLDRENHLSYFLAVGKLHIGYVRDYDKQRQIALNCLDKLIFIDRTLRARINCPLYTQCDKQSKKPLSLKKTNVFRSHKDYRAVYNLLKWFYESDTHTELDGGAQTEIASVESYLIYCGMLSVFAAGHFNFEFDETASVGFTDLHTSARFGDWKLSINKTDAEGLSALLFTVSKEREYKILLMPAEGDNRDAKNFGLLRQAINADEYIAADPTDSGADRAYISLFDLDSFRRIQQMLLRGMIYADEKRDICPFCGKKLARNEQNGSFECDACRTVIGEKTDPDTGKIRAVTSIKNFVPDDSETDPAVKRDKKLLARYAETKMYFRNITPIG